MQKQDAHIAAWEVRCNQPSSNWKEQMQELQDIFKETSKRHWEKQKSQGFSDFSKNKETAWPQGTSW